MNEAERIWSEKSDDELIEAAADLDGFTEEGKLIVRAELKRRGLEDPVEQVASVAGAGTSEGEAAEPECLRCHVPLRLIDPADPRATTGWSWVGELSARLPGRDGLDVYVCPRCGHVDFFADLPEEEDARKDTDEDEEAPTGPGGWAPG
jgi:hypothetical protein